MHSFASTHWVPDTKSVLPSAGDRKPPRAASRIVCVVQSPAVDVVAVGLSSGAIALLDIKRDAVLFTFQVEAAAVRRKRKKD